jgi:hypothetical protein
MGVKTRSMNQKVKFSFITTFQSKPNTFDEASKNKEWKTAINEEYTSTIKNNTWEFVRLPGCKKPIRCICLYKTV